MCDFFFFFFLMELSTRHRPTKPSRTNTKEGCHVHYRDWNAKVESQEISQVTGKLGLGVQNEAGQRLTEFCQENAPVIANTLVQQHKRWLYTWTTPDGQYWNQIDYILCSQKWRRSIQSAKTRLGADCGSDHELLTVKFRLKESRVNHWAIQVWKWKWQPLSHVWLFSTLIQSMKFSRPEYWQG